MIKVGNFSTILDIKVYKIKYSYLYMLHLFDIYEKFPNFFIKVETNFLQEVILSFSKTDKPWREKIIVQKLGFTFNETYNLSPGFYSIFMGKKVFRLDLVKLLIENSFFTWNDFEKNLILLRSGKRGLDIKLNFPLVYSRSLGLVVGHILGDGSIDKRYKQIMFTNSNNELIKEFYLAMKEIFPIEPRIWIQKSDFPKTKWLGRKYDINDLKNQKGIQFNLFYPTFCGEILNYYLGDFAIGKNKQISSEIKNGNLEFKRNLIRAFFDSEGSVDLYRSLRFNNDNIQVLEKLKEILLELGIESKPIRTYIKGGKTRAYFNICSYINIEKYFYSIGITSTIKNDKLIQYLKKVKPRKYVLDGKNR